MEIKIINIQEKFNNLYFNKEIVTLLLDIKADYSSLEKNKKNAEEAKLSQKKNFILQ